MWGEVGPRRGAADRPSCSTVSHAPFLLTFNSSYRALHPMPWAENGGVAMKLLSCPYQIKAGDRRIQDLRHLLEQPTSTERRVRPGCDKVCGCKARSRQCNCSCSAFCADAERHLSSDPQRHPIERRVLPLVYSLASLRVVHPCWSCEGHDMHNQSIRLPQVWFYASSPLYPELITWHLAELEFRRETSQRWVVSVCQHTVRDATIFQVAPGDRCQKLGAMQADLGVIARTLEAGVRTRARQLLSQ
jgi:hypothetical protein